MPDLTFTTKISGEGESGFEIRGHQLSSLIDQADFVSTVYLSITGSTPTPTQNKLLNALLVAAMDHGIMPASMFIPRAVASSGNDIIVAMASSLLGLGPFHGGAVTAAMNVFENVHSQATDGGDVEKVARQLIKEYRTQKKRVPGFGHRKYKQTDPRAQQLFNLAQQSHLDPLFIHIAQIMEMTLEEELGRKLPINIDGALAALLLSIDFPPKAGNAIFALARVAGSIAHIIEEQESGEWVRRIPEADITYNS